jgi:methyl-accepting chemotaxis protein
VISGMKVRSMQQTIKKTSITVKIWLSVGVFALGFVPSTVLGQVESFMTEHTLRASSQTLFPAAQGSQEAEAAFERTIKGFSDAVIMQDASGLDRAAQDGRSTVDALKAVAAIHGLSPARQQQAQALASSITPFVTDARSAYGAAMAGAAAMNADTQGKMQKLAEQTDSFKTALHQLKQQLSSDLHSQLSATQSASKMQRLTALGVFLLTLFLASLIVHLTIRRAIAVPITRVIDGLQAAAEHAWTASGEMAQSGQAVAREAQQQAAYIEETSASLEEISASTRQNAARATEADTLMREAGETVGRAAQAMTEMTSSMSAISQSSKQVSDVLKSIDEIAFHTNILALNAAVEAARAGQAGAGFSVVADEVRSLARRAADAARDSGEIIGKTMKDVAAGVESLSFARQAFDAVASNITSGSTAVTQIAASSQEQARGVAHIGQAISKIGELTQNTAGNASGTAQAGATMADQLQTTREHLDELASVIGLRTA